MSTTKVSPIRAVMGFNTMTDLVLFANGVLKGLTGNASFPNPAVLLTTFGNDITVYSNAVTAALDGGKNAKAARDKERKAVIKELRQLAMYVESNCNDDMTIFTSSGFVAKTKPSPTATVAVPGFKKIDYGNVTGQLLVTIQSAAGAKAYNLRYAVVTNGTPGAWTVILIANIRKPVTIPNLTPGTTYAFQIQGLGSNNTLSDWSDSTNLMCT